MDQPDTPDYSQFTTRDFVLDDSFRQWVLQPSETVMSFWHTFMLQHPEQQATLDEAIAILLHLRVQYDDLTEASQSRIWQVLEQAYASQTVVVPLHRSARWWQQTGWQIAASVAGLLLLGGSLRAVFWPIDHRQSVHTNYGETKLVSLPDGSTVRLNGNSTLSFEDNWDSNAPREVWLEGEGFFKVTKLQTAARRVKFVAHTTNLDVSVLGTQFNVNTRRGNTDVTLVEGRIQLSKPGQQSHRIVVMKPGDFATAPASIEQIGVRTEKPQLHTAWVQHTFVFDDTPLQTIAQQLLDTYGVTLIFEDEALANRHFTGNLSSQDLETLLTTVAATFNLQTVREGDRVYFRKPLPDGPDAEPIR